jgi:H+/Cl- antiporter ClcA
MLNNFLQTFKQPKFLFWLVIALITCIVIYKIFVGLSKVLVKIAEIYTKFVEIMQSKKLIRYSAIVFITLFVAFWKVQTKEPDIKTKEQNILIKLVSETIQDATKATTTVKPK